jgi:4'-phosphopantetheinyl transferase
MTTVELWYLPLAPDGPAEREAWNLLTPDEQRAVDRYRDPRDRAARVRARALLRTVLGVDTRIVETEDGKPVSSDPAGPRFSVSHSRAIAVVATCPTCDVGVDVEPRRDFAWREVADRFFAAAERAAIDALPPNDRLDAFFATWVRKEACLKGIGVGFTDARDDVVVPLGDGFADAPAHGSARWYVHGLALDAGHAAALAVEGGPATVAIHRA